MRIDRGFVDQVIQVARQAGSAILQFYEQNLPIEVQIKSDHSPVTLADVRAHEEIEQGLHQLTPDIPLLSEEGPFIPYAIRKKWDYYWLVDPLDGTREFIARTGQFTVNIALIHQSRPVLGVIYVPLKNQIFAGAQGVPSFKEREGISEPLKTCSWDEGDPLTIVTTRRELHEQLRAELEQCGEILMTYRSSSLKFCLISEGRADIYLRQRSISEWDTAAGQGIVENAGGQVFDSNWQVLSYNTKSNLRNPPFIVLGDVKRLLPFLKKMPIFKEC